MRPARVAALTLAAVLAAAPVLAVTPDEILADPGQEARARSISAGLRCLVCQNQSIDDSDAGLAKDLRVLVRERIVAGDSDADVRRFLVDRYGDFVLLKPPFDASTLALWLAPLVALLAGGLVVARRFRAPLPAAGDRALSASEKARLDALLARPSKAHGDDITEN